MQKRQLNNRRADLLSRATWMIVTSSFLVSACGVRQEADQTADKTRGADRASRTSADEHQQHLADQLGIKACTVIPTSRPPNLRTGQSIAYNVCTATPVFVAEPGVARRDPLVLFIDWQGRAGAATLPNDEDVEAVTLTADDNSLYRLPLEKSLEHGHWVTLYTRPTTSAQGNAGSGLQQELMHFAVGPKFIELIDTGADDEGWIKKTDPLLLTVKGQADVENLKNRSFLIRVDRMRGFGGQFETTDRLGSDSYRIDVADDGTWEHSMSLADVADVDKLQFWATFEMIGPQAPKTDFIGSIKLDPVDQ